jgi:IS5 family transposase
MMHEREGQSLRRRAGGYAHAKQFKRLRQVVRRQRTILGVLLREVPRKMTTLAQAVQDQLKPWLERAERIRSQRRHDKNKLYALHAPEVECISKGKARKPYEFGVKVSLAVAHKSGLIVGARSFPGNPFDGHTLSAQLEQTNALLQDLGVKPKVAVVDLGYRSVDADIAPVELIHRGKYKSLNAQQRCWLKRRQEIEPTIGHTKHDHRMDKCWLLRALRRQLQAGGLKHVYSALIAVWAAWLAVAMEGAAVSSTPMLLNRVSRCCVHDDHELLARAVPSASYVEMDFAGLTP